jgi:hypothetical protein
MPAPIVEGLTNFIMSKITNPAITVWDGEVPQQDPNNNPITPLNPPPSWPAFRFKMPEGGGTREWTLGTAAYLDSFAIEFEIFATTRQQLEGQGSPLGLLGQVEAIFANASNWGTINLGSPYFCVRAYPINWTCYQLEGIRTQEGQYLYIGKLWIEWSNHGAIATISLG